MRLIDVKSFELVTFPDERSVKYAILSHRWEEDEVLYEHITSKNEEVRSAMREMKGWTKIKMCCRQAERDGYEYVWVDTCCIDKTSSAELQEAINSMFRWYARAEVCYAYLFDDFRTVYYFKESQWFKRGWTLQELLAPARVQFFDRQWTCFGDRYDLRKEINQVTGIAIPILERGFSPSSWNRPLIAEIMSWARGRQTTRVEDRAYSLMGLFDVNMAMLYGEGEKAFRRLQEEIMKETEDQSIFAWEDPDKGILEPFAPSPDNFPVLAKSHQEARPRIVRREPHTVTNQGVSMAVQLIPWTPCVYLAVLNSGYVTLNHPDENIGLFVRELDNVGRYARVQCDHVQLLKHSRPIQTEVRERINIVKMLSAHERFLITQPTPFGGFDVQVYEGGKTLSFDVVPAEKSICDPEEGLLGLIPGESGFIGEIILPDSFAFGARLSVSLAFFDDFIPHLVFLYDIQPPNETKSPNVSYLQDEIRRWNTSELTANSLIQTFQLPFSRAECCALVPEDMSLEESQGLMAVRPPLNLRQTPAYNGDKLIDVTLQFTHHQHSFCHLVVRSPCQTTATRPAWVIDIGWIMYRQSYFPSTSKAWADRYLPTDKLSFDHIAVPELSVSEL